MKKIFFIAAVILAVFMVLVPAVAANDPVLGGGNLDLKSSPSGANVYVDGAFAGTTPVSGYSVTSGEHRIRFALEGYEMYETTVTVNQLSSITVNAVLSPISTGSLSIESIPSNASVRIDGVYQGTTPLKENVAPGSHRVVIEKDGYNLWSTTAKVESNGIVFVNATLTPSTTYGYLSISSNPNYSDVYVDGSYKGQTPLTLTVTTGVHTVKLSKSGYTGFTTKISVYDGSTSTVNGVLSKDTTYAYISVSSSPNGAAVYIDGEYKGNTPSGSFNYLNLTVTADTTHTLQIRLGGFSTYTTSFRLSTGEDRTFSPSLSPDVPTTAVLSVQSSPSNSAVYIDGSYVGSTPYVDSSISAGKHTVKVSCLGYADYTTSITIEGGKSANVLATLTPTPSPSKSPFPVIGLLIGLGAAALIAGRKIRQ